MIGGCAAALLALASGALAATKAVPEAVPALPAPAVPGRPAPVQLELPFPPAAPAAAPAPAPPAAPEPPTAAQFNRTLLSMYSYRALAPEQREGLRALVDEAVAKKDVTFLTQLALLTSSIADAPTRNMLYFAVYLLKLRNLLVYSKDKDDYQIGLDAERALAVIERFSYRPLEEGLDEKGRPSSGRRWIYLQLRSRYLDAYAKP